MLGLDVTALLRDLRSPETPHVGAISTAVWPWLMPELEKWLVREG